MPFCMKVKGSTVDEHVPSTVWGRDKKMALALVTLNSSKNEEAPFPDRHCLDDAHVVTKNMWCSW